MSVSTYQTLRSFVTYVCPCLASRLIQRASSMYVEILSPFIPLTSSFILSPICITTFGIFLKCFQLLRSLLFLLFQFYQFNYPGQSCPFQSTSLFPINSYWSIISIIYSPQFLTELQSHRHSSLLNSYNSFIERLLHASNCTGTHIH